MKLIYGEKTVQRLPKFDFPEDFSLSGFLKHYINIAESIILIKEITFHKWISTSTYFVEKNERIQSFKICVDDESEWITKDGINVLKVKNGLGSLQTKPISSSPLTWMEISKMSSKNNFANGTISRFCSVWKMDLKWGCKG